MKRNIWILIAVAVLAVVVLLVWAYQRTGPTRQATQLLPASTMLFLHVPDLNRARSGFTNTHAYALWQEPEVQAMLETSRRMAADLLGMKPEHAQETGAQMLAMMEGEVFFALTKIALLPSPQASVVVGADLKGNRLKVQAGLAYQERQLRKLNPAAQFVSAQHLGMNYSAWKLAPRRELYHTFVGSMIVFTSTEEAMRDVIARARNRAPADAPSLAESETYKGVTAGLPAAAEFAAFVNVEQISQMTAPLLLLAGQGGSALQRFARIKATGWATTFRDRQFLDIGHTTYNAENRALPSPTGQRTLPLTTADTMLYAAQSINWGSAYQESLDALASNPRAVSAAMQFDRALRRRGVRPREDFFHHLGPETAFFGTWRDGARFPTMALAVEVTDNEAKARVGIVMDALKNTLLGEETGLEWEKSVSQNREYSVLRLGAGVVAPTYVLTDNLLIIASTPDYARHVAETRTSALAARIPPGLPADAHGMFYCDLAAVTRPLYGMLRAGSAGANPGLPQTDTLVRHLTPYVSATVTKPRSETTTTISSLGKPLTLLTGLAGIAAVVKPYLPPLGLAISPDQPTTSSSRPAPLPPGGSQRGESAE